MNFLPPEQQYDNIQGIAGISVNEQVTGMPAI